ncbi:hypothetical protein [Flavobacterium sp. ENC]|uniref:hypothetical protein n=1 Tax=Flavobacterium sp. ENC TaxID=2897330 RepID=UPI001E2AC7F4|nr:hypothetical protein [Flavobacterium sp. ENC]MCD0465966.1 hypothetical protein [Flavobacterium sp. ENC]
MTFKINNRIANSKKITSLSLQYSTLPFFLLIFLKTGLVLAQDLPILGIPQIEKPEQYQIKSYGSNAITPTLKVGNKILPEDYYSADQKRQQQQQHLMNEADQEIKMQFIKELQDKAERDQMPSRPDFNLPSLSGNPGTEYYRNVYEKMLTLNAEEYSLKEVNFDIENAYFENKMDKAEFDKIIKQTGEFLISKMKELKYDTGSSTAKNFMLFQYFSETMQLKSSGLRHQSLKYDFEDYRGINDWSKMFVTKLLSTGKGQCHSMPLLYLILAEQIDTEAYLAVSPEHSYIRFQEEHNDKWYNVELTNGMFSTNSFLLNSGYIKAEALQNKIYLQNHTKKELLSRLYSDLAAGYVHKFGYDAFVLQVADKALELYPNNISAQMIKSNYYTEQLAYALYQLNINPESKEQLEQIIQFPEVVTILRNRNLQYKKMDDLGYEPMPAEAYEKWLHSINEEKNKRNSETFKKQFKGLVLKKTKE